MARPRKNPEDPKWKEDNSKELVIFAAVLSGLVTRGGMNLDQMIKTAKEYSAEAIKQWEQQ